MIKSKSPIYYLLFPFRLKMQKKLLSERLHKNFNLDDFKDSFSRDAMSQQIAEFLWNHLRDFSLVENFRPDANDDFLSIYGIADEELDDDIIASQLMKFGFDVDLADAFSNEFDPIKTPLDVARFIRAVSAKALH